MLVPALALLLAASTPPASADLSTAHRLVTLADYLANDYGGSVANGVVTNQFEYQEQVSLAAQARSIARSLAAPPTLPGTTDPAFAAMFERIETAILARAAPAEVAAHCRTARDALVAAYALPTFPREPPDHARGRALYLQACAACHGADGNADNAVALKLDPLPRRFTDPEVAATLSPYRVFNTASFGVTGTAMPAFGETVSVRDRWDLAFYVLALGHGDAPPAGAEAEFARSGIQSTLAALAVTTDEELAATARSHDLAAAPAAAAIAFARRIAPYRAVPEPLDLARSLLARAVEEIHAGQHDPAARLALDAYLEGVEPAEGVLRPIDPGLTAAIENGFVRLREALRRRDTGAALAIATDLDASLARARDTISGKARSPWYAFLGGFAILLREGLEAALVIGAILGLLKRLAPGERTLFRRVHLAWVSALALGVVTWLVARSLLPIGPGEREAAEGVIALVAAALLFSASYWLLSNLEVRHWLDFLRRQVEGSLRPGRGLTLFFIAFLAVYREMFESVLFFEALLLGAAGAEAWVVAGAAAGAAILAAVIWVLFHLGAKLPLKPFFAASSVLLGVLSFILAGQGIYALQQAGYLPAPGLRLPALPSLGIHPTVPGIVVQGAILVLFVLAAVYSLVLAPARARAKGSPSA